MSKYCGKCDVYDHFCMIRDEANLDKELANTDIYHEGELLSINNVKELALYFPYIIGMGSWGDGHGVIHLSKTDYIRERELESLKLYVELILKEKRRLKRKKLPYLIDDIFNKLFGEWYSNEEDIIKDIIRKAEYSNSPNVSQIRLPFLEYERNVWFEDLTNVYGYSSDFARCWVWHLERSNNV